jgi:hypothetical protein
MILADGKRIPVTADIVDRQADIAWLTTDERVDGLSYAVLAPEDPKGEVPVWHAGFGIDKPGNLELGTYTGKPANNGKYQYRLRVSSGDSGGPIVWTEKDWVLSPVCCTTERSAMADVFGGSPARGRALRPIVTASAPDDWTPSVIPLVSEMGGVGDHAEWRPFRIPVVASK